ncbi:C39 family peptidase [Paenibacillus solani]|uniref:C39 family peptidase n=1 Tax=Paenibacillus solani TaxID=1705565 RepID=UPI003D2C8DEB
MMFYYYRIPRKDVIITSDIPGSYMILTPNRMDIQPHYECAAFSSAYVLRHLGIEADGNELYKQFPRKLADGTVTPKGILIFFKKRGYDALFYRGNLHTLKKHISQGVPVIAFIRVSPKQRYLHFVPVIGYDQEFFYLADSLEHTINCKETSYNRKIGIRDFEILWRTWVPFCKNTYIVIHKSVS